MPYLTRSVAPHGGPPAAGWRFDAGVALVGLLLIGAWDLSGLDIVVTRLAGDPAGFAWRHHWFVGGWLHDGARVLGWIAFGLLFAGLRWPAAGLQHLSRAQIAWLLATGLACVAGVTLLKRISLTSCPWSLAEFGGAVASYVPHWWPDVADGGPGSCFPSGHASTGFAFLGTSFALRRKAPAAARRWLAGVVAVGALLAAAQVVRGAHYVSHTLWTAWICWVVTAVSMHAFFPAGHRRAAQDFAWPAATTAGSPPAR